MTGTARQSILFASCALAGACTAVTDFDPVALVEDTDLACSDGIDNDGDSLADCQDLGCLGQRSCCDLTAVLLEDDFDSVLTYSPDGCSAPDPERWLAWGTPDPLVCDGSLWPIKDNAHCYPVGVLGRQPLALQSGLTVMAGVAGIPEPGAGMRVGLTFQDRIVGSPDDCDVIDGPAPFLSIRQVAVSGGYQLVARFDERDLAGSAVIADDRRHEVSMVIDDGGRVHYAVDGSVFARSPEGQPVTSVTQPAYLIMYGAGLVSSITDAMLVAGNQCDTPAGWQPAGEFVALGPDISADVWDAYEVKRPLVMRDAADEDLVHMYYTGCDHPFDGSQCDIGHALSVAAAPFVRAGKVGQAGAPWTMMPPNVAAQGGFDRLNPGAPGSWDEWITSMSAIEQGDRVLVWYSGMRSSEGVLRIGLAISVDGGQTFTRHPDNPVLAEGEFGAFDDRGTTDPFVVHDAARSLYRMWYVAEGFLGASASLGYAVSTDGVHWVRHDGPVLRPEDVGLASLGNPSVLDGPDGLRMWIHGHPVGDPANRIYELVNRGRRLDEP